MAGSIFRELAFLKSRRIKRALVCLCLGIISSCIQSHKTPNKSTLPANSSSTPSPSSSSPNGKPQKPGGVIDGNGGELIVEEHNPWFINAKNIAYCIEYSNDISTSQDFVARTLQTVFGAWKKVIASMRKAGGNGFIIGEGKEVLALAEDFVEVKCSEQPSLVFKLGTTDRETDDILRYMAHFTVGFAQRTQYDSMTGQSRGYIWLAPDKGERRYQGPASRPDFWTEPGTLHNVLFHEIGHIMGLSHIEDTIMDQAAPATLVRKGMSEAWQGFDLIDASKFSDPFCGPLPQDEVSLAQVKAHWNVELKDAELCMSPRNDLKVGEENTPLLLEFKRDGQVLSSQLIHVDGLFGEQANIAGNYLRAIDDRKSVLSSTVLYYLDRQAMIRGHYESSQGLRLIEWEMPSPGVRLLRFGSAGGWQSIAVGLPAIGRLTEALDPE
jgi:hypothetical protein